LKAMTSRNVRACIAVMVVVTGSAYAAIEIRSDYPGGNVKVEKIDEAANVVVLRPDLRDTKGNWFYWDFTVRRSRGDRPAGPNATRRFCQNRSLCDPRRRQTSSRRSSTIW